LRHAPAQEAHLLNEDASENLEQRATPSITPALR